MCQALFLLLEYNLYVPILEKPSECSFCSLLPEHIKFTDINLFTWSRFVFLLFNIWKLMGKRDGNVNRDDYLQNYGMFPAIVCNFPFFLGGYIVYFCCTNKQKINELKTKTTNRINLVEDMQTQSRREQLKVVSVIVVARVMLPPSPPSPPPLQFQYNLL